MRWQRMVTATDIILFFFSIAVHSSLAVIIQVAVYNIILMLDDDKFIKKWSNEGGDMKTHLMMT